MTIPKHNRARPGKVSLRIECQTPRTVIIKITCEIACFVGQAQIIVPGGHDGDTSLFFEANENARSATAVAGIVLTVGRHVLKKVGGGLKGGSAKIPAAAP